ncbi:MAG: hypothetical protein JXB33_02950 [Clostridia bacterium]|nr:hypothetical protein [Clostridia bacterium]
MWLTIATLAILALNIIVFRIEAKNLRNENELRASSFIGFIDSGDFENASSLWPYVYPDKKADDVFLADFSDLLSEKYTQYYMNSCIGGVENEGLRMIASSYFSFLDPDDFDSIVTKIYEDFIFETIDYDLFRKTMDEFFYFSAYTSVKIIELQEDAAVIFESREYFQRAMELALVPDYENAIATMRLVSPKDPVYYPMATELIEEYIDSLREHLMNGG